MLTGFLIYFVLFLCQSLDVGRDIQTLNHNAEIRLQKCVLFRLDLPEPGPALAVKTLADASSLVQVLQPIVRRHMSLDFESVVVHISGTGVILKSDTPVASLNCKHVIVQTLENVRGMCVYVNLSVISIIHGLTFWILDMHRLGTF